MKNKNILNIFLYIAPYCAHRTHTRVRACVILHWRCKR